MLKCPNCGYRQSGGERCEKCSSLFSYYPPAQAQPKSSKDGRGFSAAARNEKSTEGFFVSWRTAYRIASGTCAGLFVIVLLLIFHKSPPPKVSIDPQAAANAAAKISQAQAAAQQNQPHQLTLNSTELNSYLNANFQLQSAGAKPDTRGANPETTGAEPEAASAPATVPNAASSEAASSTSAVSTNLPAEATIDEVQSAVKDVKVDLVGDLVKAYVVFDFHGKDMSLELDGHLSSADGYLHFEPTAGELGSLPLPLPQSVLDAAVDKLMSSPENREKLRLPPGVSSIKIVNGQVVVN